MKTYIFTNDSGQHTIVATNQEAAWTKLAKKVKESSSCTAQSKGWKLHGKQS